MIKVIDGDITTLKVDAIVNAANESLLGGGGVDGAIHKAAGPELLEECKKIGGCKTGEAVLTNGYNLPAKYVIHTVGPVWQGGSANEHFYLASCYRRSLELAIANNINSIAFPAISCGAHRFPIDEAADSAIDTLQSFIDKNGKPAEIYVVCFDFRVKSAFMQTLQGLG